EPLRSAVCQDATVGTWRPSIRSTSQQSAVLRAIEDAAAIDPNARRVRKSADLCDADFPGDAILVDEAFRNRSKITAGRSEHEDDQRGALRLRTVCHRGRPPESNKRGQNRISKSSFVPDGPI